MCYIDWYNYVYLYIVDGRYSLVEWKYSQETQTIGTASNSNQLIGVSLISVNKIKYNYD